MPDNYTLTYSETVKGWPSFYSYFPDYIMGMNQYLYTFKGGSLYRHNTNPIRNRYYGVNYSSSMTSVFNQEPTTVKVFKTIELESDDSWDITMITDLGAGSMTAGEFVKKEGSFFAFIKRISGTRNLALRSTQGIGVFDNTLGASPGVITLEFSSPIASMIQVGDECYYSVLTGIPDPNSYGVPVEIGPILTISGDRKTITVDAVNLLPPGSVIPAAAYILVLKDAVAESYGATGYFLEFTITNDNLSPVELFTVDAEVFKSNP
tara:strand:- start:2734 stop:3525 length:792 start_codon:yes stop_codon:yes gene_type:complete